MIEKSVSFSLALATIAILGQPPSRSSVRKGGNAIGGEGYQRDYVGDLGKNRMKALIARLLGDRGSTLSVGKGVAFPGVGLFECCKVVGLLPENAVGFIVVFQATQF